MSGFSKNNTRRDRKRRAFTLMEMVVVVTIIAILATLIAPRLLGNIFKAKASKAKSTCSAIATQIKLYSMDAGLSGPSDGMDLQVLLLPPDAGGATGGPYLNKADDLIDPWGNPYIIRVPGQINYEFDVVSYGADAAPGGDGENADLTN